MSNLSIRSKTIAMVVGISTLVLVLAILAYMIAENRAKRVSLVKSAAALARVIGVNASAPLAFNDPDTAREILAALSEHPNVLAGSILTTDGSRLAGYIKATIAPERLVELAAPPPALTGEQGFRSAVPRCPGGIGPGYGDPLGPHSEGKLRHHRGARRSGGCSGFGDGLQRKNRRHRGVPGGSYG